MMQIPKINSAAGTLLQAEWMVRKQYELNTLTKPDWLVNSPDYSLAALVEIFGEAVDHTPWKWWKKGELHSDRLFLEMIDVIHFLISELWVDLTKISAPLTSEMVTTDFMSAYCASYMNYDEKTPEYDQAYLGRTVKQLARMILNEEYEDALAVTLSFIKVLGYSFTDVFNTYLGKAVLNEFRQLNGYKEGTYVKMWVVDNVSAEDNDYLQTFLKNCNPTLVPTQLVDASMAFLTATYAKVAK